MNLVYNNLNKTFYKMFSDLNYNFDAIYNQQLFLCKPSFFNDPFDSFIGIDEHEFEIKYMQKNSLNYINGLDINYVKETLQKILYEKDYVSYNNLIKQKVKNEYNKYVNKLNEIRDNYYIACFTLNPPQHNMAMWSFYANNYKGFCCDVDFNKLKFDLYSSRINKYQKFIFNRIKKVEYKKMIAINIDKLLDADFDNLDKDAYIKSAITKAIITKDKQWSYENEYRLIIHKDDLQKISEVFRRYYIIKDNGVLIDFPFISGIYIKENSISTDNLQNIKNISNKLHIGIKNLVLSTKAKIMVKRSNYSVYDNY